jgi:hypothetical protein
MRRTITLASTLGALLATAIVPTPALADRADCSAKLERNYSAYWHAVDHKGDRGKLHKGAQGRNIRKWGVELRKSAKRDWRPARCVELRTSLSQLKRLQNPPPLPTLTVTATAPAQAPAGVSTATPRATGAPLASIRQCESGGNYSTNTGNGFFGAYQFDQQTWNSVGGSGNPAAASPAEQDKRAAILYSQRGASPWPTCGQ